MFDAIIRAVHWVRTVVPVEKRNVFVVYGIILSATFLESVNTSAALTLATNIKESFNSTSSITSWVLSAYTLTLGSFLMVTGKVADVIGAHNVFLLGLTIFWVSALICACIPPSSSIIVLIVFRALQGVGASALIPATTALAANYFSGDKEKYLSQAVIYFILILTSSTGAGVLFGGIFAETSIGYQSFFYFTFAIALVCDVLLFFLIIPIKKTKQHAKLKFSNINFVSSALVIIGVLLIIVGLIEGGNDWRKPSAYVPLVVGVFTFLASFFYESFFIRRFQNLHANEDPESNWRLRIDLLFPPAILKIPNFLPLLLVSGLYFASYAMVISIGTQYYIYIEHNSPIIAALKVFPIAFGFVFGVMIYRRWIYEKIGLKNIFILSTAITLGTCIWYSRSHYTIRDSYWIFGLVALFLYGVGMNMFFNIYMATAIENTPLHLQGVVSGIFRTDTQVLLSIGNALIPSIAGNIGYVYEDKAKEQLHHKFQTIFYVIMGFHAVCLITMLLAKNPQKIDVVKQEISGDEEKTIKDSETDNTVNK